MRDLDREQMRKLANFESDPCVTILLPVPALGAADRQSPVRLANLIRDARAQLARRGVEVPISPIARETTSL